MTRKDLLRRLGEEAVSPSAYDLEAGQKDEVYCLEQVNGGWAFYYRERGLRRDERVFSSESAAIAYFLSLVLRDPTTRAPRLPHVEPC